MIEEKQQKSRTRTSMHLSDPAPDGAELFGRDRIKKGEIPKAFRMLQDATRKKHLQKPSSTSTCHLLPSWAECSSQRDGRAAVGQAHPTQTEGLSSGGVPHRSKAAVPCSMRSSSSTCGDTGRGFCAC